MKINTCADRDDRRGGGDWKIPAVVELQCDVDEKQTSLAARPHDPLKSIMNNALRLLRSVLVKLTFFFKKYYFFK